jgi:hypothetical protein
MRSFCRMAMLRVLLPLALISCMHAASLHGVSVDDTPAATNPNAAKLAELQAQIDLLTKQQALAKAESDLAAAQAAVFKNYLPTLTSGREGAISNDGAPLKGTIAGWNQLVAGLDRIGVAVKNAFPSGAPKCSIAFYNTDAHNYEALVGYLETLVITAKELERLKGLPEPDLIKPSGFEPQMVPIPLLVGPAIEALVSITKLFRVDRTISSSAITVSDESLLSAVAKSLLAQQCDVLDNDKLMLPAAKFLEASRNDNEGLLYGINEYLKVVQEADTKLASIRARISKLKADDQKRFDVDTFRSEWEASVTNMKKALGPIVGPSASASDAAKIVRGEILRQQLKAGTKLLLVKMESLGATRVQVKGVFAGEKQFFGGGVIVTYRLFNADGSILTAGSEASHSNFEKAELPKRSDDKKSTKGPSLRSGESPGRR